MRQSHIHSEVRELLHDGARGRGVCLSPPPRPLQYSQLQCAWLTYRELRTVTFRTLAEVIKSLQNHITERSGSFLPFALWAHVSARSWFPGHSRLRGWLDFRVVIESKQKKVVSGLLGMWQPIIGARVGRLHFQSMRTKCGSCNLTRA